MAITSNGAAPYAPTASVKEIIRRYRGRGLEIPFTKGVLRKAGVADSLTQRTLQSFRLLDLIDDSGYPTELFVALGEAPSSEYETRLTEIIQAAYAPILAYADPHTDSVEQVEDAFRGCTPRGMRPRMVTLFFGLCKEAGLIDETPARKSQSTPSSKRSANGGRKKEDKSTRKQPIQRATKGHSGHLPSPMIGMLDALPEAWAKTSERDDWLTLFTAALDYSIKVRLPEKVDGAKDS